MTPDPAWWWRLAAFLTAQTALIVGAAAVFNYKIRAPQARRAVWQAALIALACVWLGECAGFGEKVRGLWPSERVGILHPGNPFVLATESPAATGPVNPPPPVHREAPATPVTWPGKVWLLGTMLLLLRAVAMRVWLAWQRRRMGFADVGTQETVARLRAALGLRRVETRTWARLRGPIAFGWWRPTVAVPAGFSRRFTSAQREAMFAHELAHLAGRDPLWLTLADTVCALAWWNPPAWWAARQLRDASEAVADEASALVPSGPSALAESLLCFGRELAESGLTRGLGIAGNGFRSGLGRRVNALLTFPVKWRELPARARWSPRILALGLVLILTALPILSGPSGSVFGLLVQSAQAQPASPLIKSTVFARVISATGVTEEGNPAPIISPAGASNGAPAHKSVVLAVKMATVLEGSPGPAALDKLFGDLPPDQPAGPDAVAQFLHEAKIAHTNNFRLDYFITKNKAATLTSAQFKATVASFLEQSDCNMAALPQVTALYGRPARVAVEEVQNLVTDVTRASNSVAYVTDPVRDGMTATMLPAESADGCALLVLSRNTQFLGYDKPAHPEKDYTLPLPHLRVNEIQGGGTVQMGETLALRGPAFTQTNKLKDTVLGIFHRTHTDIVRKRLYLFVTPISETK